MCATDLRELADRAGRDLEGASALDVLRWADEQFGSTWCVTSSMADAVVPHLASQVRPGVDVVFLDTGYHFAETIGTRDAVAATLPVTVRTITPEQTVAEQDASSARGCSSATPTSAAHCARLRRCAARSTATRPGRRGCAATRSPVASDDAARRVGRAPVDGEAQPDRRVDAARRRRVHRRERRPRESRCSSTGTGRSAARRARAGSSPARTLAPDAGRARRKRSAASTDVATLRARASELRRDRPDPRVRRRGRAGADPARTRADRRRRRRDGRRRGRRDRELAGVPYRRGRAVARDDQRRASRRHGEGRRAGRHGALSRARRRLRPYARPGSGSAASRRSGIRRRSARSSTSRSPTYPQVWAAGGIPHAVFPTTYDELLRLTGGRPAEVA